MYAPFVKCIIKSHSFIWSKWLTHTLKNKTKHYLIAFECCCCDGIFRATVRDFCVKTGMTENFGKLCFTIGFTDEEILHLLAHQKHGIMIVVVVVGRTRMRKKLRLIRKRLCSRETTSVFAKSPIFCTRRRRCPYTLQYAVVQYSPVEMVLAVCSRVPADWQKDAPAFNKPPRTDMSADISKHNNLKHNMRAKVRSHQHVARYTRIILSGYHSAVGLLFAFRLTLR